MSDVITQVPVEPPSIGTPSKALRLMIHHSLGQPNKAQQMLSQLRPALDKFRPKHHSTLGLLQAVAYKAAGDAELAKIGSMPEYGIKAEDTPREDPAKAAIAHYNQAVARYRELTGGVSETSSSGSGSTAPAAAAAAVAHNPDLLTGPVSVEFMKELETDAHLGVAQVGRVAVLCMQRCACCVQEGYCLWVLDSQCMFM
eukprot:jgi/Chrzof1/8582/Cz03g16100.t1